MKKFLLAGVVIVSATTTAMAADLAPAAPAAYDWTGFYLGLNAGAAWNNSSVDNDVDNVLLDPLVDEIESNQTVFTGGGEMGFNWQVDSLVLGVEADFNYLGFDDSADRSADLGGAIGVVTGHLDLQEDWYGTLRGRLGFAADNFLIYGTGGLAYGNVDASGKVETAGGDTWKASESNVNWGWTIGAGAEYAFDQNWIVGAEYMYVDLGNPDFDFDHTSLGGDGLNNDNFDGNVDAAFSVVRATIKYKF